MNLETELAQAMAQQRRLDALLHSLLKQYPTRLFLMAGVSRLGITHG
jgi:hypothetical protein